MLFLKLFPLRGLQIQNARMRVRSTVAKYDIIYVNLILMYGIRNTFYDIFTGKPNLNNKVFSKLLTRRWYILFSFCRIKVIDSYIFLWRQCFVRI